jgi:hypothetical protein
MTEQLFEPLDLLAERRLGNASELGRFAEMKCLRHRQKIAKMA